MWNTIYTFISHLFNNFLYTFSFKDKVIKKDINPHLLAMHTYKYWRSSTLIATHINIFLFLLGNIQFLNYAKLRYFNIIFLINSILLHSYKVIRSYLFSYLIKSLIFCWMSCGCPSTSSYSRLHFVFNVIIFIFCLYPELELGRSGSFTV